MYLHLDVSMHRALYIFVKRTKTIIILKSRLQNIDEKYLY